MNKKTLVLGLMILSVGLAACNGSQTAPGTALSTASVAAIPSPTPLTQQQTETRLDQNTLPAPINPTELPTWTSTPDTQKATAVPVNIFDANTFPDKYKAMAANPFSGTAEQQADYQSFLEAQREAFFVKQGIKDVVDRMAASGKIDPRQKNLWGMVYYESLQKTPGVFLLGPEDSKNANDVEMANIIKYNLNSQPALWDDWKVVNGKKWAYEFNDTIDDQVSGMLLGVGRVDSGSNRIAVVAYRDQQTGDWNLVLRAMIYDGQQFVFPKGTTCIRWDFIKGTPFTLEEDAPVGVNQYDESRLLAQVGHYISIVDYSDAYNAWLTGYKVRNFPAATPYSVSCQFPYKYVFLGAGVMPDDFRPPHPNYPWNAAQGTATPTP